MSSMEFQVDGAWYIAKWVWVAILFVWLAVQLLAYRRLRGDLRRRSFTVFWVVFVLDMVFDWIRTVFENPQATRIAMLVVGAAAIIATILLARMLFSPDRGKLADTQVDAAEAIQSVEIELRADA